MIGCSGRQPQEDDAESALFCTPLASVAKRIREILLTTKH